MNSKNYAAYRKNIKKEQVSTMFDNLIVGDVMSIKKINPYSITYIKEEPKFIFQKVKTDDSTKYIEIFSGMIFDRLDRNKKGPFVVNEEPLLNYIDLDTIDINNINLLEISDQINTKDKEKELVN